MFKKVMKGIFMATCAVIGAIGGAATANDIIDNIAELRQLCKNDEDTVESAEES